MSRMTDHNVSPGDWRELGANYIAKDNGVNFAVYAENAESISISLFNNEGAQTDDIHLPGYTNQVWHGFIKGLKPGQLYGVRAYGRYDPANGLRYNPTKLLLDPYARLLTRAIEAHPLQLGYSRTDNVMDKNNSASVMPKCVVADIDKIKNDSQPIGISWEDTVIYETHVKGFTFNNPDIRKDIRGTFKGMAASAAVDYLKSLGISSVEFLPVQAFFRSSFLVEKKLNNYWGYDPVCYFALHPNYGSPEDFALMVRVFHEAGIEVIMDVVYNHTGESGYMGPHLCYRGIDNKVYYRLQRDRQDYYEDHTGCGATFNAEHPAVLRLVLDSLRYWVQVFGVDGFRFDLATVLARYDDGFNYRATFLQAVSQDPVLSRVKMIAEPWDLGLGGYQVGAFPAGWSEWNDQYRDITRRFWKGDSGQMPGFASSIAGSAHIFNHRGRQPSASVNFITAHDGFTMRDLVSYNNKHNQANGEQNRDGNSTNWCWNSGYEGETRDDNVIALRRCRQKALMATLLLSRGTPMILGGDEAGRTQNGNNNVWAQDSALSWHNWKKMDGAMLEFTRQLLKFRHENQCLTKGGFFTGQPVEGSANDLKDVIWLTPEDNEMTDVDWGLPYGRAVACMIAGQRGQDDLFLVFNSSDTPITWLLPAVHKQWYLVIDTSQESPFDDSRACEDNIEIPAWSVMVFKAEALYKKE